GAAGLRVLQPLPGLGAGTAARIADRMEAERGRPDVLAAIEVPKAAAETWPGFARLIAAMRTAETPWPAEFELVRQWYQPHLERIYAMAVCARRTSPSWSRSRRDTNRAS